MPDYKGTGFLSHQSTLTPPHFSPVPNQEFLTSVCLVSLSLLVHFYVTWVHTGNSFAVPLYNDVLGPAAACPVVWGLLVVHWRRMGGLGLTFSYQWGCCLFDICIIPILLVIFTHQSNTSRNSYQTSRIRIPGLSHDKDGTCLDIRD